MTRTTNALATADWLTKQATRHAFRVGLFKRRGMDDTYAWQLADRMWERDAQHCELRMCIECSNLQRGNTCHPLSIKQRTQAQAKGLQARPFEVIPDQFIRCPHFDWAKPA